MFFFNNFLNWSTIFAQCASTPCYSPHQSPLTWHISPAMTQLARRHAQHMGNKSCRGTPVAAAPVSAASADDLKIATSFSHQIARASAANKLKCWFQSFGAPTGHQLSGEHETQMGQSPSDCHKSVAAAVDDIDPGGGALEVPHIHGAAELWCHRRCCGIKSAAFPASRAGGTFNCPLAAFAPSQRFSHQLNYCGSYVNPSNANKSEKQTGTCTCYKPLITFVFNKPETQTTPTNIKKYSL